jgi:NitT/TauT family transport system permease protein
MSHKTKKYYILIWRVIRNITPGIILLLLWQFYVGHDARLRFLFSSPSLVLEKLIFDIKNSGLLWDVWITGEETVLGFLLGCFIGTLLGLILWSSTSAANIARPYIVIIGSIPIFAIAPMTIIWFGTDLFQKVMIAALSTVVVALAQAYEGAKNVDPDLLALMKTFGATRLQIYRKVIVPATLVWVIASLRLNIGFALLGAFIGEFISSERGLGHYILKGSGLYDVSQILAGIVCLGALSLFMSMSVGLLERILLPSKFRRRTTGWLFSKLRSIYRKLSSLFVTTDGTERAD